MVQERDHHSTYDNRPSELSKSARTSADENHKILQVVAYQYVSHGYDIPSNLAQEAYEYFTSFIKVLHLSLVYVL